MSENGDKIRNQILHIRELPTLPSVVDRILRLVSSPDTTAQDLNKIIANDMSLSSKILRLANSAFYGLSRKVDTITEAVVYLGFNMVKAMALSVSVFDLFRGSGTSYKYFSREALWRHAIACGVTSRIISRKIKHGNPETIFMSGILHDIGKVIVDHYSHQEFREILAYAEAEQVFIKDAEEHVLGVNHAKVGYWLAEWWKLPEVISDPIYYHHNPAVYRVNTGVAIVHVANALCRQLQLGNSGDELFLDVDPEVLSFLNLPISFLAEIESQIREELEKADIFLSFTR